jgi:hypothetical protein
MAYSRDHIAVLKERYDNALSRSFAAAAETAARRYGLPISKLPLDLIRSIAAADGDVLRHLDEWRQAVVDFDRDGAGVDEDDHAWRARVVDGYQDEDGGALTVGRAIDDLTLRLNTARRTLVETTGVIASHAADGRSFWIESVMEVATVVRVESGATLTMLQDVARAGRAPKHDTIRRLQDEARLLRDDAKALIDLARARLGY